MSKIFLEIFSPVAWPLYSCMTWPHLMPQKSFTLLHSCAIYWYEKCHTLTVGKKEISAGQKVGIR